MSKERQSTDGVNAGRSGGGNLQGTIAGVEKSPVAAVSPSITVVPTKGISNGGK